MKKSHNSKRSIIAEEKHVGYETTDWEVVASVDYDKKIRETLNHYRYFYDYKTAAKWSRTWAKLNLDKLQNKNLRSCEDSMIPVYVGWYSRMSHQGLVLSEKIKAWMLKNILESVSRGEKNITTNDTNKLTTKFTKSPADILKGRSNNMIAEIDSIIDQLNTAADYANSDFSMYDILQNNDTPYVNSKRIYDYYKPKHSELIELVEEKPDDLVEAYDYGAGFSGIKDWNKIENFYAKLINDLDLYMNTKKVTRKIRTKKVKTASTQIQKLKYKKDAPEYKIASENPVKIIGARQLAAYNTKIGVMMMLYTTSRDGFQIQGTSIKNVDVEKSNKRKIRKPELFFSSHVKSTKSVLTKAYNKLTTKPQPVKISVQINPDVILWKIFK